MKKTKIIGTIGPASVNKKYINKMIIAGMNVARINMSYQYKNNEIKEIVDMIRNESEKLDASVSILFDLCGPKVRVAFEDIKHKFKIKKKQRITLGRGKVDIPINIPIK